MLSISVLSPDGAGPGWLFSLRSLFSHSLLCELFNPPLQKGRECGWEGR